MVLVWIFSWFFGQEKDHKNSVFCLRLLKEVRGGIEKGKSSLSIGEKILTFWPQVPDGGVYRSAPAFAVFGCPSILLRYQAHTPLYQDGSSCGPIYNQAKN